MRNCLTWFKHSSIDYKLEIMAGITNFMAIAYIVIVNPIIMNANGHGFAFSPTVTATVISIIFLSWLAGLLVKLPFAMAPGMEFNVIITYTLVIQEKLPIPIAMGVLFWSGVIFLIFIVSNLQQAVVKAIPQTLQCALEMGIGAFIIFIGLKSSGLVVANPNTLLSLVKLKMNLLLAGGGFLLTTVLFIKNKRYALLAPIIIITIICNLINKPTLPQHIFAMPDFSLFAHADLINSFKLSLLPAILSVFLMSFFDSTSTTLGLISQAHITDQQIKMKVTKRAFICEALGAIWAAFAGTAKGVVFIESAAGIELGAKTGVASLITGILFIPFLFLAPLIGLVPLMATAPTSVLVGILMINHGRRVKINALEEGIAIFVTVVIMPLCFSITAGAVFGIITYVVLKLLLGKFNELNVPLILVALACFLWFLI